MPAGSACTTPGCSSTASSSRPRSSPTTAGAAWMPTPRIRSPGSRGSPARSRCAPRGLAFDSAAGGRAQHQGRGPRCGAERDARRSTATSDDRPDRRSDVDGGSLHRRSAPHRQVARRGPRHLGRSRQSDDVLLPLAALRHDGRRLRGGRDDGQHTPSTSPTPTTCSWWRSRPRATREARPSARPRHVCRARHLRSHDSAGGASCRSGPDAPARPAGARGAANGDNPSDTAKLDAFFSANGKRPLRSSYGKRTVLRGKLTRPDGTPIGNARIELLSTHRGARRAGRRQGRRRGHARTARGR